MPTAVNDPSISPVVADTRAVPVPLEGRAYEVLIGPGLLPQAGRIIAERLGAARYGIVTDENVAHFHLATLEKSLGADGRLRGTVVLPPWEAT